MRNLLLAATALAGLAIAQPASAGLMADVSIDGGLTWSAICAAPSGTACGSPSFTANGLTFTLFGITSNSPGTPTEANVFQATVLARNLTGVDHSVILRIGDTGYTAPLGNTVLLNNIAGTVTTGRPSNAFTSTACVNPTNAQSSCVGAGTVTTSLITAAITSPGVGAQSNTASVSGLTGPYSITEFLNITLGAGANVNFITSSDVNPAMEPASLAVLGVGMVGLGIARRKRRDSFAGCAA